MAIFGILSLDALISLLLIETAWWGNEFLGKVLDQDLLAYMFLRSFPSKYFAIVLIYLLKFLGQGILWYNFLWNKAENQAILLKTWFWVSAILDVALVTLITLFIYLNFLGSFTVLFVRFCTIFIGYILVSDLSKQQAPFFPEGFLAYVNDRSRLQTTLTIMLIWEFGFYSLSLSAFVLATFGLEGLYLFEDAFYYRLLSFKTLVYLPVFGALFQLIGVTQMWKQFLKFWFPVYILCNLCYVGFNILHLFTWVISMSNLLMMGRHLFLFLCGLALKLGIITRSYMFIFTKDQEELVKAVVPDAGENKPLILGNIK